MSVLDFKTAGEKNLKNFMKGQQSTKNVIDITIITLNKTLSLENYSPSLMFYSKSFLVKSRGSVLHMQEKITANNKQYFGVMRTPLSSSK